jgi:ABC-2 type transport system permease protein
MLVSAATENQLTAALVTFFVLFFVQILDTLAQLMPSDIKTGVISASILILLAAFFVFLNTRNWFLPLALIIIGAAAILILSFGASGHWRIFFIDFDRKVFQWFSLNKRYSDFPLGLLKIDSLIYYTSFCGLFLFLTVRHIEKRHWN